MEIERKFLIEKHPEIKYKKFYNITQSYINYIKDFYEIRLRKYENEDIKYYLDFKGKGDIEREEFGIKINKEQYDKLIVESKGTLNKTRYYLLTGEFFDIYKDKLDGLKILEFEGTKEMVDNYKLPDDWVGKEITYDYKYKNRNLIIF